MSLTPCTGHQDGDACRGVDVPRGVCTDQVCVPRVCGDLVVEGAEACDDANALSHDGCDSECQLEVPTWTARTSMAAPTARFAQVMAYDAARARIVMFGGADLDKQFNDTYEWDGTEWTLRAPATSPAVRAEAAMVYDAERARMVMFGGTSDGQTVLAETWEWDGETWTQRTPATSPPARMGHGMAYDATRARVVMFGGTDSTDTALADTWEWDGTTWTEVTPSTSPPARSLLTLTYDPLRRTTLLFGGANQGAMEQGDTWEWNGSAWTQRTPAKSPLARRGHAMAYDAARGRVVVYGGGTGLNSVLADMWEWDGTTWTETAQQQPTPGMRFVIGMVADDAHRAMVVFGGLDPAVQVIRGDTWLFRYTSAAADESCDDSIDDDHDGLAGCADPDCWAYCTPQCPPMTTCDPSAPQCGDATCNAPLEMGVCPKDCG